MALLAFCRKARDFARPGERGRQPSERTNEVPARVPESVHARRTTALHPSVDPHDMSSAAGDQPDSCLDLEPAALTCSVLTAHSDAVPGQREGRRTIVSRRSATVSMTSSLLEKGPFCLNKSHCYTLGDRASLSKYCHAGGANPLVFTIGKYLESTAKETPPQGVKCFVFLQRRRRPSGWHPLSKLCSDFRSPIGLGTLHRTRRGRSRCNVIKREKRLLQNRTTNLPNGKQAPLPLSYAECQCT